MAVEVKLKEGQYPSVIPVVDSTNGQPMGLEIIDELPKREQLPPVRHPVSLGEVIEEMLRDLPPLGPNGVTGQDAALLIMRQACWRYDDLRKFLVCWEDLHSVDLHPERKPGCLPTFEEACDLSTPPIPYDHLIGLISQACYWYGLNRAKAIMHAGLPEVVRAAHDSAKLLGRKGHADRKLVLQATGLIQESQGVNVNVNTQVNNQTNVVGLPKWDEVDKLLDITPQVSSTPKPPQVVSNGDTID